MRTLRLVLLLLLATGLLDAPGGRHAGHAGDGQEPTWRSVRHGPAAFVIDSRAEELSARPPDERVPRTTGDGDVSLHAAGPARRWSFSECSEARGLSAGMADERIPLAQSHRRVNGSANAHGARA